jgi:hypothetical protein
VPEKRWDQVDKGLARMARRSKGFDDSAWRECPSCRHRHKAHELCGYALNWQKGCPCRS